MTNSFRFHTFLCCAALLIGATVSGCASIKGTQEKWAANWKERSKPRINDPKDQKDEIVRYWGQKKPEKKAEISPELQARIQQKTKELDSARSFSDHFREGNQKLRANQLGEAKREYELALEAKPGDPDVHHRLAVVADKQRMFGVADDHYEAALRQRPRDPNLLSDLGYSHTLRGDDAKAEKTLLSALAIEPSHKGAMANLGSIYAKQGRYDDAYTVFRRGANEAETQQYMAQLFPQGNQTNSSANGSMLARNDANPRNEPSQRGPIQIGPEPRGNDRGPERTGGQEVAVGASSSGQGSAGSRDDVSRMSIEQLMAEMDKRRAVGAASRGDNAPSPSQPWNSDSPANLARPNQMASNFPGSGRTDNPLSQMNLQPSVGNQPTPGNALRAAPGTRPLDNMETWQGANVAQSGTSSSGMPHTHNNPVSQVEQAAFAEPSSVSEAAAQMALSVGPGGLFPIIRGNSSSNSARVTGSAIPSNPLQNFRMGSDYPQAPSHSISSGVGAGMTTPANGMGISLPNWQGFSSTPQPNGANPTNLPMPKATGNSGVGSSANDTRNIAPQSPTEGMAQPWAPPPNLHNWQPLNRQGAFNGSSGNGGDVSSNGSMMNRAETPATAPSRFARAPWDESPTITPGSPSNPSAPYNGNWPSNAGVGSTQPPATNSPNPLPMWNGGSGGTASWGNSTTEGSGNHGAPAQWPYSPQR